MTAVVSPPLSPLPRTPSEAPLIQTTLNYRIPPRNETPFVLAYQPKDGAADGSSRTNCANDYKPVEIHNMKQEDKSSFDLDNNGFEFEKLEGGAEVVGFAEDQWEDRKVVIEKYWPTVERMLREKTNSTRVELMSHLVRRHDPEVEMRGFHVHVDLSPDYAKFIIQAYNPGFTPSDVDEYLKSNRVQIVNVWRPLNRALDAPLCLCDWNTVDTEKDLWTGKSIAKCGRETEMVGVSYNPNHKWYTIPGQKPDECLIFKGFDSKDGCASQIPHGAFKHPSYWGRSDVAPRESLELRCVCFSKL